MVKVGKCPLTTFFSPPSLSLSPVAWQIEDHSLALLPLLLFPFLASDEDDRKKKKLFPQRTDVGRSPTGEKETCAKVGLDKKKMVVGGGGGGGCCCVLAARFFFRYNFMVATILTEK